MNVHTLLIGVCLVLLTASSTEADDLPSDLLPKAKGLERTDLFGHSDFQVGPYGAYPLQKLEPTRLIIAKGSYQARKNMNDRRPGSIPLHDLQEASLEWFKAQLAVSKSRSEYIHAAAEYLEREGIHATDVKDESHR